MYCDLFHSNFYPVWLKGRVHRCSKSKFLFSIARRKKHASLRALWLFFRLLLQSLRLLDCEKLPQHLCKAVLLFRGLSPSRFLRKWTASWNVRESEAEINFFDSLMYFSLPACLYAVLELDAGDWWGEKQERRQRDRQRKSRKRVKK